MSKPVFRRGAGVKVAVAFLLAAAVYVAWVIAWSSQGSALEPVRVGVDSCHHCGMIVSDVRYAISVLDQDEQGHTVTRHFDDAGCFQAFAKSNPDQKWVGVAHDFRTGKALPLNEAHFEKTEHETPMGSGIVVFDQRADISAVGE